MRAPRVNLHLCLPMLVIGFLVAVAGSAYAAVPAITVFFPASGTIGTNVTITGTGFT